MRAPLHLDLNEVIQHPNRRMEYPLKVWLDREEAPPQAEPITGTLVAESGGRILHLQGEFHVDVWLECARCANLFRQRIEFHLEEDYPLAGTPSAVNPNSFARVEDEEPYPIFDENKLMVEELLRQYALVQLPMQPICQEDCKGLCNQCGKNLNEGPCDCVPVEVNHPFEKLAQMWYSKD